VYSDHKICFACKLYIPTVKKPFDALNKEPEKPLSNLRPMPEDSKPQIGALGWQWLKKYDINEEETKTFLWSDEKQWLIFPFKGLKDETVAWQARNLNAERPKPKYLTYGPISDIMVEIGAGERCILTEDLLSAVKVGRSSGVIGMPIFGSIVSLKLITRLAKRFKSVGVWLDRDKVQEALKARSRLSQYIPEVFMIISEKDPKEYSDADITRYIEGARA
jgi:hypothetical protein